MVFSLDRVQQRLVLSSSLTFQFLRFGGGVAEVFKVFSPEQSPTAAGLEQIVDIPARRGLQGSLSGQGSTAS